MSDKPKKVSKVDVAHAQLQAQIDRLQAEREASSALEPVQMGASDFSAPRIIMPSTERIRHYDDLLPPGHLSIIIVGSSGSGKTYLLLSLVNQIADLSQVILCTLVMNPVYDHLRRWCAQTPARRNGKPIFVNGANVEVPLDQFNLTYREVYVNADNVECAPTAPGARYKVLLVNANNQQVTYEQVGIRPKMIEYASYNDVTNAESGISELIERKPVDTYGLIILDDWSRATNSTTEPYARMSAMVTMMLRNFGYHNCTITQSYTGTTTKSRANANMRFAFAMHEEYTRERLVSDFIGELDGWTRADMMRFYMESTKKPNSYICLTTSSDGTHLYRKAGRDEPIQVVELATMHTDRVNGLIDTLRGDQELSSICTHLKEADTAHTLPLMRRYETKLNRYIDYLAQTLDQPDDMTVTGIAKGNGSRAQSTLMRDSNADLVQSIKDAIYELHQIRV